MKRLPLILLSLLTIIILIGCKKSGKTTTKDYYVSTIDEDKYYTDLLTDDYLTDIAEEAYGEVSNIFIIYFYSPTCKYCKALMESDEYNQFIDNPTIKLYKLKVEDLSRDFKNTFAVKSIPLMLLVTDQGENIFKVDRYLGRIECLNLITSFLGYEAE